jgi:hypothetical protein
MAGANIGRRRVAGGAVGLMTCCTARRRWPSPGWGPPRPLRFPVRCPFGGPGGIWCSTTGQPEWRASSEWVTVGPLYCDWTQPCRRLLARGNGAVRPHLCPLIVTAQLVAGFSSGSRCCLLFGPWHHDVGCPTYLDQNGSDTQAMISYAIDTRITSQL